MDDDGNKALNVAEFSNGVRESGADFTEEECKQLFSQFDTDNSGSLDIDEFLKALRVSSSLSLFFFSRFFTVSPRTVPEVLSQTFGTDSYRKSNRH